MFYNINYRILIKMSVQATCYNIQVINSDVVLKTDHLEAYLFQVLNHNKRETKSVAESKTNKKLKHYIYHVTNEVSYMQQY